MKAILLSLFLVLLFQRCNTNSGSLTVREQDKLFHAAIKIEEDSLFSVISGAKHGFYYMVGEQFIDSIFIDSGVNIIDKNINTQEIQRQYKRRLKESNKLISDSFDIVRIVDFSNKSPEFLSFSKPIKYLNYYFINVSYNSWSSGYSTFLVLEKKDVGNFKLLYRRVYRVT
jgi:hypothetical protein